MENLNEALRLAEAVRHHGNEDIRNRVKSLTEEIQATQKDIAARQSKASRDLRAANEAYAAGDHRGAIDCAQAVLAVPYVQDLHAEARRIQQKAQEALTEAAQDHARRQRNRRARQLQLAAAGLAVVLAAGAGGYWWLSRQSPAPRQTNTADASPRPTDPSARTDLTTPTNVSPATTTAADGHAPTTLPPVVLTMNINPSPPRIAEAGGKAPITLKLAGETRARDHRL